MTKSVGYFFSLDIRIDSKYNKNIISIIISNYHYTSDVVPRNATHTLHTMTTRKYRRNKILKMFNELIPFV